MRLGIDLGINMGYALENGVYGAVQHRKDAFGAACQMLEETFPRLTKEYNVEMVYYERIMTRSTGFAALHAAGMYHFAIEYFCNQRKIPCIPVSSWKLPVFGKGLGNASKQQIENEMNKAGIKAETQDAYDAIGVLCAGMGMPLQTYALRVATL